MADMADMVNTCEMECFVIEHTRCFSILVQACSQCWWMEPDVWSIMPLEAPSQGVTIWNSYECLRHCFTVVLTSLCWNIFLNTLIHGEVHSRHRKVIQTVKETYCLQFITFLPSSTTQKTHISTFGMESEVKLIYVCLKGIE